MAKGNKVAIRVTEDQREELHRRKQVGDDYADVVERLLEKASERTAD